MKLELTPEQRDVLTSVRALAQDEFRSRAMEWMDGTFPWQNIRDLAQMGPDPQLAALAKMHCNEMAIRVTSEALQVHGGYGFTDEYPVSRLYRGARYGTLGGGTTETLKELVGKKLVADFPADGGFLGMGTF